MAAEQLRAFHADRPIAERRAFGRAGRDSDMSRHEGECKSTKPSPVSFKTLPLGNPERQVVQANIPQHAGIERR